MTADDTADLDVAFSAPGPGRSYGVSRRVRLGDVQPNGHVRLDAVVRYLQDAAADDVRDAGIEGAVVWVVRRTALAVRARPRYNEPIDLVTWCSGTGPAWAERRTRISSSGHAVVEAVSVWVALHPETMRPTELPGYFFDVYGAGARRRDVKSRLVHPRPPNATPAAPAVSVRDWPLRRSDFDVLGHVNNAVSWAAVEDELERRRPGASIEVGELEYRSAIEPGARIRLISRLSGRSGAVWVIDDRDAVLVSAQIRVAADSP